jgi:hypothetical protein
MKPVISVGMFDQHAASYPNVVRHAPDNRVNQAPRRRQIPVIR